MCKLAIICKSFVDDFLNNVFVFIKRVVCERERERESVCGMCVRAWCGGGGGGCACMPVFACLFV